LVAKLNSIREWITSKMVVMPMELMVGLGRVELPANGLGKQKTVLTGSETFGLYYIPQPVTTCQT
jgi:hypothetical protein